MPFDFSWADWFLGLQMTLFDLTILNKVGSLFTALMYVCIIF